jgi:hypothetical protein
MRRPRDRESRGADLLAMWFHDWMFRMDLALNLGIDFFSANLRPRGRRVPGFLGFWEA